MLPNPTLSQQRVAQRPLFSLNQSLFMPIHPSFRSALAQHHPHILCPLRCQEATATDVSNPFDGSTVSFVVCNLCMQWCFGPLHARVVSCPNACEWRQNNQNEPLPFWCGEAKCNDILTLLTQEVDMTLPFPSDDLHADQVCPVHTFL